MKQSTLKYKSVSWKQLLPAILLLFLSCQEIFSQEADSSKVKSPGLFVGISVGSLQSQILNTGMLTIDKTVSNKLNGMTGSVEAGYFFSKWFGLSTGIGYTSCKGQLTLASYQNRFNTTDTENETYERQVTGSGITENQNIGMVSIPINLNLRLPLGNKLGFFLQGGLEASIPVQKSYQSSGTFTFKGYYPAYNVLLQNLPAYGFPTNAAIATNGSLKINSLCLEATATAGFDLFIAEKVQLLVAATYLQSLSSISAYTQPEKFQLSSDINQINSLMGGSSQATIQSVGLKLSLRYYFGKK